MASGRPALQMLPQFLRPRHDTLSQPQARPDPPLGVLGAKALGKARFWARWAHSEPRPGVLVTGLVPFPVRPWHTGTPCTRVTEIAAPPGVLQRLPPPPASVSPCVKGVERTAPGPPIPVSSAPWSKFAFRPRSSSSVRTDQEPVASSSSLIFVGALPACAPTASSGPVAARRP